jgi:uncharacterized protein with von Willebrand factor type A (vWA) domain
MSALEESVEFVINTQPRCACVLILDTSGSMVGKRICNPPLKPGH